MCTRKIGTRLSASYREECTLFIVVWSKYFYFEYEGMIMLPASTDGCDGSRFTVHGENYACRSIYIYDYLCMSKHHDLSDVLKRPYLFELSKSSHWVSRVQGQPWMIMYDPVWFCTCCLYSPCTDTATQYFDWLVHVSQTDLLPPLTPTRMLLSDLRGCSTQGTRSGRDSDWCRSYECDCPSAAFQLVPVSAWCLESSCLATSHLVYALFLFLLQLHLFIILKQWVSIKLAVWQGCAVSVCMCVWMCPRRQSFEGSAMQSLKFMSSHKLVVFGCVCVYLVLLRFYSLALLRLHAKVGLMLKEPKSSNQPWINKRL